MTASSPAATFFPTFNPRLHWHVDIEQEFFLMRDGKLVPEAAAFLHMLERLADHRYELVTHFMTTPWTYEFSACQVEVRTLPSGHLEDIRREVRGHDSHGVHVAHSINATLTRLEHRPRFARRYVS